MSFELILFLVMLLVGYTTGTILEKRHYKDIQARESESTDVIVISSKKAPPEVTLPGDMVMGSVVVGSDYFKRFVAGLIGFFGGRLNIYESLLDRARREAVLRMKEQARECGANMVVNVKFETVTLNDIHRKEGAMVEVLAYGTAVQYPNS